MVANPLVLLDRLPTRESARLVLEALEQPQNLRIYQMGVWLARQKMVRGEFTPAERSELHMLVLRSWRSDAAQASEYLAELIVDLPDGMRSTLVQAAVEAGRPKLGYVVEHGEEVVATKAQAFSQALAEAAREGAPQPPAYAEDRMLARLVREALFHRDTDRRHWAALLLSASPFAGPAADALLARLNERSDPVWLRVRLATLVRYLCDDSHRLRMLPLVDDPVESVAIPVIQGLGHLSFSLSSDQQVRAALLPQWSPRERAKLYALGMTGVTGAGPAGPVGDGPRLAAGGRPLVARPRVGRAGLASSMRQLGCWSTDGAASAQRSSQSPIGSTPRSTSASWPSTEYAGRGAGRTNAALVVGCTVDDSSPAATTTVRAKSNQLHWPADVAW